MAELGQNNENIKKYKITIGVLLLIIAVLLTMLIVTKTKVNTFIVEKEKAISERQGMQKQLDSLLTEHTKIKGEYGNMTKELARKDSTIQANATEIQKLIASNVGKNQIQKKLDYLRNITQDYVDQIDKLLKENNNLKQEIKGIQENFNTEKEKSTTLQKDKEDLKNQINKAAVLQAYNVTVQGIKLKQGGKKEEVEDKAKRIDKIKISFTLSKNPLVNSGMKEIFVRIARPDNMVLNEGQGFEFNGQNIMYSLKETVNYQNKPVNISLYYEKTDRIVAGTYNVSVFSDGQEIGSGQLNLK
jgi:hypothetical protein